MLTTITILILYWTITNALWINKDGISFQEKSASYSISDPYFVNITLILKFENFSIPQVEAIECETRHYELGKNYQTLAQDQVILNIENMCHAKAQERNLDIMLRYKMQNYIDDFIEFIEAEIPEINPTSRYKRDDMLTKILTSSNTAGEVYLLQKTHSLHGEINKLSQQVRTLFNSNNAINTNSILVANFTTNGIQQILNRLEQTSTSEINQFAAVTSEMIEIESLFYQSALIQQRLSDKSELSLTLAEIKQEILRLKDGLPHTTLLPRKTLERLLNEINTTLDYHHPITATLNRVDHTILLTFKVPTMKNKRNGKLFRINSVQIGQGKLVFSKIPDLPPYLIVSQDQRHIRFMNQDQSMSPMIKSTENCIYKSYKELDTTNCFNHQVSELKSENSYQLLNDEILLSLYEGEIYEECLNQKGIVIYMNQNDYYVLKSCCKYKYRNNLSLNSVSLETSCKNEYPEIFINKPTNLFKMYNNTEITTNKETMNEHISHVANNVRKDIETLKKQLHLKNLAEEWSTSKIATTNDTNKTTLIPQIVIGIIEIFMIICLAFLAHRVAYLDKICSALVNAYVMVKFNDPVTEAES